MHTALIRDFINVFEKKGPARPYGSYDNLSYFFFGTAIILTVVILTFTTLSGTNRQILTLKRYDVQASGLVVSALNSQPKSRWFKARSLPLCCFLRQKTLTPHCFSPPRCMGTSDIKLGGNLCDGLASHPGGGGGSNTPSHFIVYKPGHPVMD